MKLSTVIKGAAISAAFAGMTFGQGTQPWFVDHVPAPGCRHIPKTPPGVELSFHHVNADIAGAQTWGNDPDQLPIYMDKDIKVLNGGTLTVLPGTWIYGGTYALFTPPDAQGNPNSFSYGTSLIILEGGKANMIGKQDSTIVMTGFGDDYRDIQTFGPGAKALWGGLIIKGKAHVSNAGYNGTYPSMEGISNYNSSITTYGNLPIDDNDNSGDFEYVSIRHGGAGKATNSEINGIGLYGVGAGTVFDHIEVMSNYDDGIEFFGGTVNMKHVCISFCDDDQFDFDQNYSGKIQYGFSTELNWMGNRCGEWDGLKNFADPNKYGAGPTFCNFTMISCGKYSTNNKNDQNYGAQYLIQLADSTKGDFRNFVILDGTKNAFWIRNHDLKIAGDTLADGSQAHIYQAPIGDPNGPKFRGLFVYNTGLGFGRDNPGATWDSLVYSDNGATAHVDAASLAWLKNAANMCYCDSNPMLRGVSREFKYPELDPRPCVNSPVFRHYATNPSDNFFTATTYAGAFDASDLWCDGWTKLSQAGCLTGYITAFPDQASIPVNASFDVTYMVNTPVAPAGVNVMFDGIDITNPLPGWRGGLNSFMATYSDMACGGFTVKLCDPNAVFPIPQFNGNFFDQMGPVLGTQGVNYLGLHTITTSIIMPSGKTYSATSRIHVVK